MIRWPAIVTALAVLLVGVVGYRAITIPSSAQIATADALMESYQLEAAQNHALVAQAAVVGAQHAQLMHRIGPRLASMEQGTTALFTVEMPRIAARHHLRLSIEDPVHDRRPGDIRPGVSVPSVSAAMVATARTPGLPNAPDVAASPTPSRVVPAVVIPLNAIGISQQDAMLLASSFVGTERVVKLTGSYRDLLRGIDELPRGRSLLLVGAPSLSRDAGDRINATFHAIVYSPRPELRAIVGGPQ